MLPEGCICFSFLSSFMIYTFVFLVFTLKLYFLNIRFLYRMLIENLVTRFRGWKLKIGAHSRIVIM